MKSLRFKTHSLATKALQAVALATMIVVNLSAHATGERAVKTRVSAVYPELAKRMRIGGVVTVEATVDADGKVVSVKTLNGNRALSQSAEDAVSKWRFVAATETSTVNVEVSFALGQ